MAMAIPSVATVDPSLAARLAPDDVIVAEEITGDVTCARPALAALASGGVRALVARRFAAPVLAQSDDPWMGTQYLYVPPDWDQMGGGANVNSCTAYAQFGNTCTDCVIPFMPRPGKPTGPSCHSVTYSASCNCDETKCSTNKSGAVTGYCTYKR